MRVPTSKFFRVFGVGVLGVVALFLLVFFVLMFFSGHKTSYRTGMYGSPMMNTAAPSLSAALSVSPAPAEWDGANGYQMMEKVRGTAMMERTGSTDMPNVDKKIIKNGNLSLRVENVDQALSRIESIAVDAGGAVSDSRFTQVVAGTKSGTVTIKVPVETFSQVYSRLKETAVVVLSENITGVDVTAEYIDLQARINNKKAAEVTLQALFERAVKISDVIEVTDKLEVVRGEIESLEGRLRYLSTQTDMASITLSLTEDVTVVADRGFRPFQTMKESLVTLVRMLGNVTEKGIQFLIVGLPVLLVNGLILWLIYRLVRRMMIKLWPGSLEEKKHVIRKR